MATAAARKVCDSFAPPENVANIIAGALSDEKLVDLKAGPSASLIKACRCVLEQRPNSVPDRDLEFTLCELLNDIWADKAWRAVFEKAGGKHTDELKNRCPLKKILEGARMALSFGNIDALDAYFSNFSRLATHATMMQDDTRTRAYYRAILGNRPDFEDKVVMDVGSGTGLLAFFAVQAGAKRVYCIEASPMAEVIKQLAEANGWSDKIVVVNKVLQEIRDGEIPEKVDAITSETLGNFLFAERGIETVIIARERWLKPGGKLYPSHASFCIAPFSDERAHRGLQVSSKNLWTNSDFYGIDLTCMEPRAFKESFRRPYSDQFHPDILKADCQTQIFDFRTLRSEELTRFKVDFEFTAKETCLTHGIAGWFEAHFEGSACSVILSTSPWDTLTHWWMTRLMLLEALAVNRGSAIVGSISFEASRQNSYKCALVMESGGTSRENDHLDLLDLDTAHRHPKHKQKQITTTTAISMIDWESTKATPSNPAAIVQDPMREAKLAAQRSEAAIGGPVGALPSKAATDLQKQDNVATEDKVRPFGSQIKVSGKAFIILNEPQSVAQWTKPSTPLVLVGSLGSSLLMTPQEQPYECLVEYVNGGAGISARYWMESNAAGEMIRSYVLKNQVPNTPTSLTSQQMEAFDLNKLFLVYDAMKTQINGNGH